MSAGTLLPVLSCWVIWILRNRALYDDVPSSMQLFIHLFKALLHSCSLSKPYTSVLHLPPHLSFLECRKLKRIFFPLHWSLPPSSYCKINVDGSSVLQSLHSGGGIVIRRDDGSVLHAVSHYFGPGTSFFAELSALVAALELCQQLGLSNVVVELDSQVLVTALSGRSGWPWRYHYQLVKAAHLLEQSRASIQHVYRECNAVADSLAKLATSTYQTHTFRMHDLPSYIKGLVACLKQQYPYFRSKLVHCNRTSQGR